MILATTVLASSLAFIDGSVVNVGLPSIARSFPADAISLSWVVSGYLLPLSALLLIGGWLIDEVGWRPMFLRAGGRRSRCGGQRVCIPLAGAQP